MEKQQKALDLSTIHKRIREQELEAKARSSQLLKEYDLYRSIHEEQGLSLVQVQLLSGFCYELEETYEPLKHLSLLRRLSLIASFVLFTEFEIIIWSLFCKPIIITDIVNDLQRQDVEDESLKSFEEIGQKRVMNHLMNSAYFTKRQVMNESEFEPFQAFFDQNFSIFEGKHTDWILLNEPDIARVSPQKIATRYKDLLTIYNLEVMPFSQEIRAKTQVRDYNKTVADLNDESKKGNAEGGRGNRDKNSKDKNQKDKDKKGQSDSSKKRDQKIRVIEFNIIKPMQDSQSMFSKQSVFDKQESSEININTNNKRTAPEGGLRVGDAADVPYKMISKSFYEKAAQHALEQGNTGDPADFQKHISNSFIQQVDRNEAIANQQNDTQNQEEPAHLRHTPLKNLDEADLRGNRPSELLRRGVSQWQDNMRNHAFQSRIYDMSNLVNYSLDHGQDLKQISFLKSRLDFNPLNGENNSRYGFLQPKPTTSILGFDQRGQEQIMQMNQQQNGNLGGNSNFNLGINRSILNLFSQNGIPNQTNNYHPEVSQQQQSNLHQGNSIQTNQQSVSFIQQPSGAQQNNNLQNSGQVQNAQQTALNSSLKKGQNVQQSNSSFLNQNQPSQQYMIQQQQRQQPIPQAQTVLSMPSIYKNLNEQPLYHSGSSKSGSFGANNNCDSIKNILQHGNASKSSGNTFNVVSSDSGHMPLIISGNTNNPSAIVQSPAAYQQSQATQQASGFLQAPNHLVRGPSIVGNMQNGPSGTFLVQQSNQAVGAGAPRKVNVYNNMISPGKQRLSSDGFIDSMIMAPSLQSAQDHDNQAILNNMNIKQDEGFVLHQSVSQSFARQGKKEPTTSQRSGENNRKTAGGAAAAVGNGQDQTNNTKDNE